jgi:hypothetical protein
VYTARIYNTLKGYVIDDVIGGICKKRVSDMIYINLRNMKRPRVSICCDINTMGVQCRARETFKSSRNMSALRLPEYLYHSI